jgi:hypothetical protein
MSIIQQLSFSPYNPVFCYILKTQHLRFSTHISPYGVWYKAVFGDGVFGYSTPPIFRFAQMTLHLVIVEELYIKIL